MLISRKSNSFDVDTLARNLIELGMMAADMPPAFAKHGISEPVVGNDGRLLGHICDGSGLVLNTSLKALGIKRKRLPFVRERDWAKRIIDRVAGDNGTLTTIDGIAAARMAGNYSDVYETKNSYTTVANTWSSTYRAGGTIAAGAYSSTPGAAKNRTDTGALSLGISDPTSGTSYLLSLGTLAAQQLNMVACVDLLVAVGSITAASLAAQTVSSAALTRYTTGAGVYATLEVTTQLGATPANHTMSYTNTVPTSGQTSQSTAMTTSAIVQRLQPASFGFRVGLAAGDAGVQAVSTSTLSASMGSGVYALNLVKPLLYTPGIAANIYAPRDTPSTIDGIVPLVQDAVPHIGCLILYAKTNTTSTGITEITIQSAWG